MSVCMSQWDTWYKCRQKLWQADILLTQDGVGDSHHGEIRVWNDSRPSCVLLVSINSWPGTQELQRNICSVRCSHLLDTWQWSSRRRHLWFRFTHNQSKKFTSVTCFPLAAWLVSFGLVRSSLIFSVKVENSCSCCPRKMPKQYFQHLHFVVHWITVVQTHNCSWYVTEQSTVAIGVAETIFYLEMCNPMQGVNKHANHETREIIAWKLYKEKRSK